MPYNIYSLFFSYNIFKFKIIIDGHEELKIVIYLIIACVTQ